MSDKISSYSKEARKHYRHDKEKEEGVNWAEIFDVHMTDSNRKAGIKASLTRLSHLIDDKQPTGIDKSTFEARYNDPIDVFLQANNYEGKKSLGKLKVLIDCIDHLSGQIPAEKFFQAELDALPEENPDDFFSHTARQRKELQERIDAGYTDYFDGPVIDKRYQQKLANLAEGVIKQAEDERQRKGNSLKPAVVNGEDLNIYLQDKAYKHIATNGYLWTTGYIPRLDSYLGPETPNPILVTISRGDSSLETVLKDILGLTKINFNSCLFNERLPVTIRFADAVGDVLVSAPIEGNPILPFKFYI